VVGAVLAACVGDVGVPGEAEGADDEVAQGGHHLGRVGGADLGPVLAVMELAP
jgi:hypothetical protein